MKISLEWLSDFLSGRMDAQVAADALTNGGLPVELIEQHGEDTVIDVEVTSNRGDCLSHIGIARELSALLEQNLHLTQPTAAESATPASSVTSVRIDAPDLCPHYTARVIRNVKIGPSPAWMVRRLQAVLRREDGTPYQPINNVVDITNYVMFEMGQPLHAFDYDRLAEKRIIVRRALGGERMTAIDGKIRDLTPEMLVIADARRPVALAGIMGGLESEVTNTTRNVLLESARFDPLCIRRTSRALALKSDSSYRFERQIDPSLPERASLRAAQLILETAGGELLSGMASAGGTGWQPKTLTLRLAKLKQVLGIELPTETVMNALSRVHLSPVLKGDWIDVAVPSYRLDLNIEVDLVEEVARVVGYGRIPVRQEISIRLTPPAADTITINEIRDVLVGAGYYESITVGFAGDVLREEFKPAEAAALLRADASVRKDNAHLRTSLLPGMLEAIRRNESVGTMGARLFEIGSTYWVDGSGRVDERRRVAIVGGEDVHEVRGAVELLLNKLNADRPVVIVPDKHPGFAVGACGRVEWGGEVIGYLGRIDRKAAEKLSLREAPAAAELELLPMLKHVQHVPQLRALPRYPAVWRDLSLVVTESVRYEQVDAAVRELGLPDLESVEHVTTYRGKPLAKGTKSLSIRLVFRSPTTTLTNEQVEASVQKAIAAATEKLGATLRA